MFAQREHDNRVDDVGENLASYRLVGPFSQRQKIKIGLGRLEDAFNLGPAKVLIK